MTVNGCGVSFWGDEINCNEGCTTVNILKTVELYVYFSEFYDM